MSIKSFIKSFATEKHPMFLNLWLAAKKVQYWHYSRMTYPQIEAAISRVYREVFGRELNWENPQTYNEKIHVSKLYMPSPLKTRLADKVAVREWITEKIGSEYLIPLLGVYDSFDQIDFDALPEQFVIKCSHDSGSYTLVKDKSTFDRALLRKYDVLLKSNYAWQGFEMHYRDIVSKIVVEQFIDNAAVNDYRFYCFDGKPFCCAVDYYDGSHKRSARNIYDMNWEILPFLFQYPNYTGEAPRPDNYDELKVIAEKLAEGFPHVRVDLYTARDKVYFGEMTFSHANGFQKLIPNEWDYKLGSLWPFDSSVRAKVLAHSSRP